MRKLTPDIFPVTVLNMSTSSNSSSKSKQQDKLPFQLQLSRYKQQSLARATGLSQGAISRILNGKRGAATPFSTLKKFQSGMHDLTHRNWTVEQIERAIEQERDRRASGAAPSPASDPAPVPDPASE
jgi:helix-turn-helix protein